MNLQQLRAIKAIVSSGFNISAAADRLFTSQPGVSKQLRLLEEELGVQIFQRSGKQLVGMTDVGKALLPFVYRTLDNLQSIKETASDAVDPDYGRLILATTHSQACYVLPDIIEQFTRHYPAVEFQVFQGSPQQIVRLAASGEADFAIATEAMDDPKGMIALPCYHWTQCVVAPQGHKLSQLDRISLVELARYPLLTYTHGFSGRQQLEQQFSAVGLQPRFVFSAMDASVIKTYVRKGMGVGIIAGPAYTGRDSDLVKFQVEHLFDRCTARIGFRDGLFLRRFHYEFLQLLAPHLTRKMVEDARALRDNKSRAVLFMDQALKMY